MANKEAEMAERLKLDRTKAIKWVKFIRESLPDMPVVEDSDLRTFIGLALDGIRLELDTCHKNIENL